MTDETEEDLSDPEQIPEREGVSQMGEEETPAESRVYETDEVVPDETNEDGSPVVSDLPDLLLDPEGNPPETSFQDESQPESSQSQESSQETTAQEPETAESSNPGP